MNRYEEVARILLDAADLIEPDGAWTKGTFMNENGAHCAVGAIRKTGGGITQVTHQAENAADEYVQRHLKAKCDNHGPNCCFGIIGFNNNKSTTQQEVVDALRTTGKMVQQGELEVNSW